MPQPSNKLRKQIPAELPKELRKQLRDRLLRAGIAPRHIRRYLAELYDHLTDLRAEENLTSHSAPEAQAAAESATLTRLGSIDTLADAMTSQPHLRSFAARAPWAAFALAPIAALAAAWAVGLFILWLGWNVFLPYSATPFVRIQGVEILVFGSGRLIYFAAPILTGWAIALTAARQRLNPLWPTLGILLVSVLGGASQVHVRRSLIAPFRHVSMGFVLLQGSLADTLHTFQFAHFAVNLILTGLPYLLWTLTRHAMNRRSAIN
jgi:hypothetical protein